jgi:hypothetical protein
MVDFSFSDLPIEWENVVKWSISKLRGKGLQASLGKLYFKACVYHLWQQRNVLVHNNNPKSEEAIVK